MSVVAVTRRQRTPEQPAAGVQLHPRKRRSRPSTARPPAQDHPALARKVLLQSAVRPSFPSLFHGRERAFESGNILAVHGEKHKSLRAAWQPMFFSGRRGPLTPRAWLGSAGAASWSCRPE